MRAFLFAAVVLVCLGCAGEEEPKNRPIPSAAQTSTSPGKPAGPMMGGPMMGGQAEPTKDDAKRLKDLETAYNSIKARYTKSPSNAKLKKQYIDTATKFGHESMVSPVLDTKVKYRQALKVYREVLKLDPANKIAKPEYDLIVSIYKQMGRPIPKD